MSKILAPLIVLLSLAACSSEPMGWYREGSSADQSSRDQIACEQQARVNSPSSLSPSLRGIDAGSGSGVNDAVANAARQTGYASDCMRDKGYRPR